MIAGPSWRIARPATRRDSAITAGREIENYIALDLRVAVLKKMHGDIKLVDDDPQYGHPLEMSVDGQEVAFDKVKVARAVCALDMSLDILDLATQVRNLVGFIRKANRLS
jgi:hypothetical protein